MTTISFTERAVAVTAYDSHDVAASLLASGAGDTHAYLVEFAPGGEIGPHDAGFDQLFLVLAGTAWIVVNGARTDLTARCAVALRRGDQHTKGSDTGATVLMIQSDALTAGTPGVLP